MAAWKLGGSPKRRTDSTKTLNAFRCIHASNTSPKWVLNHFIKFDYISFLLAGHLYLEVLFFSFLFLYRFSVLGIKEKKSTDLVFISEASWVRSFLSLAISSSLNSKSRTMNLRRKLASSFFLCWLFQDEMENTFSGGHHA